ncbi:MAG: hypothetical protein EOS54_18835 [Mesorhizobium sp.]|uniref:hypothetical protein n=1 Tax=unclassified Mesorhizobium TaxID=325217 RepID=UPI000FD39FE9|nr:MULTISPECIES: hypothetical protein [unclassified Mesorhizobium]RVD44741.1 hypothetical protein EN742_01415 [Mesorhizobium sp. M4A.F.Ca.ET.020.02.1.1]RWC10810.1 MAG: hypothetical protein EOS53_28400 [Mesorhizobium sp.]RWC25999.1 MAG: hypothetical protein EOS70_32420 [Mesorhizobium sp.]RWC51607.1 MAG: hypothetical protein EOS54_18835 [Mesorhizobium sp.]RWD40299.1 MAG: hypothetical protein EOS35_32050 [Mesorhizobium sp.]
MTEPATPVSLDTASGKIGDSRKGMGRRSADLMVVQALQAISACTVPLIAFLKSADRASKLRSNGHIGVVARPTSAAGEPFNMQADEGQETGKLRLGVLSARQPMIDDVSLTRRIGIRATRAVQRQVCLGNRLQRGKPSPAALHRETAGKESPALAPPKEAIARLAGSFLRSTEPGGLTCTTIQAAIA